MQARAPSCRAGCGPCLRARQMSWAVPIAEHKPSLPRATSPFNAMPPTLTSMPCTPRVGMRAESMHVLSPPKLRIASEAISEQQMPDEPPLVGDVGTCPSEGAQTRTSTSCVAQPQIAVGLSEKLSDEAVPQAVQGAHNRCCAGSVSSSPQPQIAMPTDRMHKSDTGCFESANTTFAEEEAVQPKVASSHGFCLTFDWFHIVWTEGSTGRMPRADECAASDGSPERIDTLGRDGQCDDSFPDFLVWTQDCDDDDDPVAQRGRWAVAERAAAVRAQAIYDGRLCESSPLTPPVSCLSANDGPPPMGANTAAAARAVAAAALSSKVR